MKTVKTLLSAAIMAMIVPLHSAEIAPCVAIKPVESTPSSASRLWGRSSNLWPQDSTIAVAFTDGTTRQQDAAWQRIKNIDNMVNLTFVKATPGQIRIGFAFGGGHWSYLGRTALSIDPKKQTMNIALSTARLGGNPATEWDRVVYHEMLHAIGFEHEHQSPNASIPWNREAVYAFYGSTQGWSRRQIDQQVLKRTMATDFFGSGYDPLSIMQYPVPKDLTTTGFSVGWNTKFSRQDLAVLGATYPNR